MSGGIYTERKFEPNIKCIIFAFTMIAFYWVSARFANPNNFLMFLLIFVISYVAMAWYDVMYNCSTRLYSGKQGIIAPFDSIFKDQLRQYNHSRDDTVLDQEKIYQKNVYLFHILFVVPVLAYVGIQGYRGKLQGKDMFSILIVTAVGALIYHGYRFFKPRQTCNIVVDKQNKISNISKGNLPENFTSTNKENRGGTCSIDSNSEVVTTCATCSSSQGVKKTTLDPIMEPLFNLREIAKHLILLEDHLFHEGKRCPDCILKHVYTIDAFFDEAITLDKKMEYNDIATEKQKQFKIVSKEIEHGVKTKTLTNDLCCKYAQELRKIRKPLVQLTADMKMD